MMEYNTEGIHVVADFYDVAEPEKLNMIAFLYEWMGKAIKASNAELLKCDHYAFKPQGFTVYGILSESSIDFHTYPEHSHIAISIHTCGEKADPVKGFYELKELIKPKTVNAIIIKRGNVQHLHLEEI